MTVPWTPLLGDIGAPGSINALAVETAARIAADNALQAEISAGVSSVFGRVGAVTKQGGDYNFSDLGNIPNSIAGYGITDFNSLGDARWLQLAGGTLTGKVTQIGTFTDLVVPQIFSSTVTYNPTLAPTSGGANIVSGGFTAIVDGATTMPTKNCIGMQASAAVLSTRSGALNQLYGGFFLSQKANVTGDAAAVGGVWTQAENRAGNTPFMFSFGAWIRNLGASTTTAIAAGVYIQAPQNTGTITTLAGLYIQDQLAAGGTVGTTYSIRAFGLAPSLFDGPITAQSFITSGAAPALATSAGVAGQLAWDANFIYICVAANTWKRVAVSTFP